MAKHWYRYETTNAERKDGLCRFLRRQRLEHESGGPARRKLFGKPGGAGHIPPQGPVFFVKMYLSDAELGEVNKWLHTH